MVEDPAADDSSARKAAADSVGSSVEVLGLLIEDGNADPNARNYEALKSAFWACDHFLVGMLLKDDRFQPTSLELKDIYHSTKDEQTNIPHEIDGLYTEAAKQGFGAYMRFSTMMSPDYYLAHNHCFPLRFACAKGLTEVMKYYIQEHP
jgi:hypothetical protein